MKKKDLKTGMLVKVRDGNIFLFIYPYFISNNSGYLELNGFDEDLYLKEDEYMIDTCDIVGVSSVMVKNLLLPQHWNKDTFNENIIWSREEDSSSESDVWIEVDGVKYPKDEVKKALEFIEANEKV